jgi:hypothetical protein
MFKTLYEGGEIAKSPRVYRLIINYRHFQIECPVSVENGIPVGIMMPAFKLPYRPYPVYVYLFAVIWYLANATSMRKAAKETRKKFGLEKFSHSTLSRVFSVLALKVNILDEMSQDESEKEDVQTYENSTLHVSSRLSESKKKAAPVLFRILSPLLTNPYKGIELVYQFFIQYGALLI